MGASDTATVYARFARSQALGTSAVYEDWAAGVAGDPEVLALLEALPAPKRQPNLLFAAARLVGAPSGSWTDVGPWVVAHWDAVAREMRARATQTNEPRRCAVLLPALAAVDGPVALVEVGASAGLCLYPDRYSYDYTLPDGSSVRLDPADGPSDVVLPCRIEGPVPSRLPDVVQRLGVDLNPLDLRDPDAMAWLEALVWPEHADRLQTLRAAARLVTADPPLIVRGDLNEHVRELVAQAPADATVVVQHSAVFPYLSPADSAAFVATMAELRASQGVVWVANEGWTRVPAITTRLPGGVRPDFVVAVDGAPVAVAEAHGRWVHVLADSPGSPPPGVGRATSAGA